MEAPVLRISKVTRVQSYKLSRNANKLVSKSSLLLLLLQCEAISQSADAEAEGE